MRRSHQSIADSIQEIGGEALDQSGFEKETPEPRAEASPSEPEVVEDHPNGTTKEGCDVDQRR